MAFWNSVTVEPKRTFRYKVSFAGNFDGVANNDQLSIFAQKVDKPSFTMENKEYQYMNHTFNYPGRVKWKEISMEFVDAGRGPIPLDATGQQQTAVGGASTQILDVATTLMRVISKSGYVIPDDPTRPIQQLTTISKSALNSLAGNVTIEQLDPSGATIEEWILHNAMLTNLSFGSLSYDTDEIGKITATVVYDWATIDGGGVLYPNSPTATGGG